MCVLYLPHPPRLPPNWVEAVSRDKRLYYYNTATREATYEHPNDYVAARKHDTGNGSNGNGSSGNGSGNGERKTKEQREREDAAVSREEVAEWVELLDPASGNVYYANSATRAVSWTPPHPERWARAEDGGGTVFYYRKGTKNFRLQPVEISAENTFLRIARAAIAHNSYGHGVPDAHPC